MKFPTTPTIQLHSIYDTLLSNLLPFLFQLYIITGRYVGSRPIKLRKSSWKQRSFEVVKRKEKEKTHLLQMFNK